MGSNYFGRNESSSNSSQSSSSRKGKKNGSDKPKQPQRGLGVAQLEKIRLHSQLGYLPSLHNPYAQEDIRLQPAYPSPSSTSFSYSSSNTPPYGFPAQQGVMMGLPDIDRATIRYGDSQVTNVPRWHQDNAGYQQIVKPSITRPFFETGIEGSMSKKNRKDSMGGSSSQNSDSNGIHEIDLELRLSR